MQKTIAIIPARGGSKGIKKKNIRIINFKPLLVHSIESALNTSDIDRVFVSTDDSEISDIAIKNGAEVIWRPSELSTDIATSESALIHALNYYKLAERDDPKKVIFLQATSPLRNYDDISNAINLFESTNADSLFSSSSIHGFIWCKNLTSINPINYNPLDRKRRQDLSNEMLEENGSIYIFKPWVLRELNSRLGGKVVSYKMSWINSFQIDELQDIQKLELIFELKNKIDKK